MSIHTDLGHLHSWHFFSFPTVFPPTYAMHIHLSDLSSSHVPPSLLGRCKGPWSLQNVQSFSFFLSLFSSSLPSSGSFGGLCIRLPTCWSFYLPSLGLPFQSLCDSFFLFLSLFIFLIDVFFVLIWPLSWPCYILFLVFHFFSILAHTFSCFVIFPFSQVRNFIDFSPYASLFCFHCQFLFILMFPVSIYSLIKRSTLFDLHFICSASLCFTCFHVPLLFHFFWSILLSFVFIFSFTQIFLFPFIPLLFHSTALFHCC